MKRRCIKELGDAKAAQMGGKARSLLYLRKHGFTIPQTRVCGFDVYGRYRAGDKELLVRLEQELTAFAGGHTGYAVRSSANVEGGGDHSFAGQFKSYVGVKGVKNLINAIEAVWQSADSDRVRAYAQKVGQPFQEIRMAVIVQEMVTPQLSGVVFTKNPSAGTDEVIVEAVKGLGAALVSQGETPARWVHKWGRWTEVPPEGDAGTIIIENVVQEAKKIERAYGKALNLEWTYDGKMLYWLQLRELTTTRGVNIYSNRIAKEFLPGMIKPLVWSINIPLVNSSWKRLFIELLGDAAKGIDVDALAHAFYYRAYFNMGVVGDLFELLGMPRESVELLLGIDVPGDDPPKMRPRAKTIANAPRILSFAARQVIFFSAMEFVERQRRAYDRFLAVPPEQLDAVELIACARKLIDVNRETSYFVIISQLLPGALSALLRRLTRGGLDAERVNFEREERMLQDIDPSYHLSQLHDEFARLPKSAQELAQKIPYEELRHSTETRDFGAHVAEFLRAFGHVSDSGNDFSVPQWRECPEHIVRMIADYAPRDRPEQTTLPPAEQAWGLFTTHIVRLTRNQVAKARVYKERIGFLYAYGYGIFRRCFLQLGRLFEQRGLIGARDDVFYLTFSEATQVAVSGVMPKDLAKTLAKRKQEMVRYAGVVLPDLIIGEQAPPLQTQEAVLTLRGVPASNGYYRGRVTTVSGIKDFQKVRDGDVLVMPYSDVGWTPLFRRAGAVISAAGGVLSHAAIVAREYGVPAVVSVRGANDLVDGTTVAVDGFTGEVRIVRQQRHAKSGLLVG